MSVREIMNRRRQALRLLRSRYPEISEMAVTVQVTPDAVARLAAMDDGLPVETVAFPPIGTWPWAERPALLIYDEPVTLDFHIIRQSYHRVTPYTDTQQVQAHLMIPPGLVPHDVIPLDADERIRASLGAVIGLHNADLSEGYMPFGAGTTTGGTHDSLVSSDIFNANLVKAIGMRLLVVSKSVLNDKERWEVTLRAGTSLQCLDVPRIGATVASAVASVYKPRDHYTEAGVPKVAYTQAGAETVCLEYDNLESYTCPVCAQLHVGHRR